MIKEEKNSIQSEIKKVSEKFLKSIENKKITIISHFDTDGITSAAIAVSALKKLDKEFELKIIKNLEKEFIYSLPKENIILFLDLGSGSLNTIEKADLNEVFILDHHEITEEISDKINIINPELIDKQKISGSGLTYLFFKEIDENNKSSAKLAILGMIGDTLEKEIENLNNGILNDADIKRKRGLLIYPSTRPINRTLEYCSNPFIPGVTGDTRGVLELLREIQINPANGRYKSLIELSKEEMEKLVTAIMLRNPKTKNKEIIGDIFLLKFFNKLEDARELSAMINACSRMDEPEIAVQFCMEIPSIKKRAESIHARYKQHLISGLKFVSETEKIQGKGFVIINFQNNIKDTIVGTIASILSNSAIYEQGTIIINMAYTENSKKIKISARSVGNSERNLRQILNNIVKQSCEEDFETGGHKCAAGALIPINKEKEFIKNLKKTLEIETIKV